MHLSIQTWTDNTILRTVSSSITMAELHKYRVLGEAMLAYVRNPKHKGIGLAAPQVGMNKRMVIVGLPAGQDDESYPITLMVNPLIVKKSPETEVGEEGCLSLPGIRGNILRSIWVDAEWVDIKGKKMKKRITGFGAKVLQHEVDHLDGILISDKFLK